MTQQKFDWLRVLYVLARVLATLSLMVNGTIVLAHLVVGTWSKALLYMLPFTITLGMITWLARTKRQVDRNDMMIEIMRHEERTVTRTVTHQKE
jgi:hypothetical protein